MREQPFKHADRGVERAADRTVLDLAVPAAVLELLIDQAIDHALDVLPEVGAERDDHAVDAGLDLALEERLAGVLPAAVVPDQPHGSADAFVLGIHAVLLQLHEAVRGRGPRLALVRDPTEAAARHARGTARRLPTGRRCHCSARSRAPQPSAATLARSAPTTSAGASHRSRSVCQRMEGSESSSHSSAVTAEVYDQGRRKPQISGHG